MDSLYYYQMLCRVLSNFENHAQNHAQGLPPLQAFGFIKNVLCVQGVQGVQGYFRFLRNFLFALAIFAYCADNKKPCDYAQGGRMLDVVMLVGCAGFECRPCTSYAHTSLNVGITVFVRALAECVILGLVILCLYYSTFKLRNAKPIVMLVGTFVDVITDKKRHALPRLISKSLSELQAILIAYAFFVFTKPNERQKLSA